MSQRLGNDGGQCTAVAICSTNYRIEVATVKG